MTTLILLILLGTVLSLVFIYMYVKEKKQVQLLENTISTTQSQLKKYEEDQLVLRQELDLAKGNLHNVSVDHVTNLLSWQFFEDRLDQTLKESARYQFTMGILYIDIDDFSVINDALNHEVGNLLLREVADRLQSCIRQVDSMSRYAKDTFVAMLTQLNKPETAAVVAQRMLQALEQPFQIQEHELYITVSIGIAIYPIDGDNAAALLTSAERAMRRAKAKAKHGYQFAHEQIHADSQRELSLSISLHKEKIPQEFTIYYQPVMDMVSKKILCMDAVLHWHHPEMGIIKPQELFTYAIKQGKLNMITEWLMQNACKQFLYWQSLNFKPEAICVPISLRQLESSNFVYRISQILQELEFNPEWLILELKHAGGQFSYDVLEKTFNMLKYLKVKLAIGQFGNNQFSLRDLKHITADYLKVDPVFVTDIVENPHSRLLLKAICGLAQTLSVPVIIQEVETHEQESILKEMGCTILQGKLIGEAIPEREMLDKIISNSSSNS